MLQFLDYCLGMFCISCTKNELVMNQKERILFAAKHAFLKYGYNMATVKRIAKYSDTTPAMIRYYYRSKYNLYEMVFPIYVEMLIGYLKKL